MRKVVTSLFISLDGVTQSPDQWQFDHFDEDLMAGMTEELAQLDTVLLGRVTYQEWANYWPTSQDEPYASHINSVQKYVVSTTLNRVAWGQHDRIELIRGNLKEEIARLKQQPGQNIGVAGSPTLVRSLLQQGLLDQLSLLVHPVIAGRGKHLFEGDSGLQRMELVYSKPTRTGVIIATYRPRAQ